jgi:hypothetical protein
MASQSRKRDEFFLKTKVKILYQALMNLKRIRLAATSGRRLPASPVKLERHTVKFGSAEKSEGSIPQSLALRGGRRENIVKFSCVGGVSEHTAKYDYEM